MGIILTVRGTVVRGDGIAGKEFNIPTANLFFADPLKLDFGVYAATVYYQEDNYDAVVVYGAGQEPKFEVHLFDFSGDLYGKDIKVKVLKKVSEIMPWVSKERMRQKILHDIELVLGYFELGNKK